MKRQLIRLPLARMFCLCGLILLAGQSGVRAALRNWTGGSADKNWSTAANWTTGVPGTADIAIFTSGGSSNVLVTNNIVSANITVLGLDYQTNNNGYATTRINDNITLTINNTATGTQPALQVGGTQNGDNVFNTFVTNTVAGSLGTMVISGNGVGSGLANQLNFQVRQAAATAANFQTVLDMSDLGTLTATVGKLTVGQGGTGAGQDKVSGRLALARTNTISLLRAVAGQFVIGDSSGAANQSASSLLELGITNAFYFDTANIGKQKTTNGIVRFNPAFTNLTTPTWFVRNTNGVNTRVSDWNIGDAATEATVPVFVAGVVDLSGGRADALVERMLIGEGPTTTTDTGFANGTLTFEAGTVDANSLKIGVKRANNTATVNGTVNVNGTAILLSTGIELARVPTGVSGAGTVGLLNINGGTVKVAGNIASFGGFGTNNVNSGVLDLKPGAGAAGSILASALNLGASGAARLTNAATVALSNSLTLTANGRIDGSSTTVIIPSGSSLKGNGLINAPVTIGSGASIQPSLNGTDTSTLSISNTLSLAGTTVMSLNRDNGQNSSRIQGVTTLTMGGTLTVNNNGSALQAGDTFLLFDATTRSSSFSTVTLPSLSAGLTWYNTLATDGKITVGQVSALTVESAADGSGSVVGAQNVAKNGTKTVYAILRDNFGQFYSNPSVSWSLINKTGSVVDGDLSPSTGSSTTFTANNDGTAQIHADYNSGTFTADSGTLTVISSIDHYDVTLTSPQTAGSTFTVTVTAKDAGNSTVNDSATSVTLTSNGSLQIDADNNGTFGDTSLVLSSGVAVFHAKDNKAETINVTATDTGSKTGTYTGLVINPGAATRLIVTLPGETFTTFTGNSGTASAQSAGVGFNLVSLSAVDNFNNVDPGYSGSKTISYSGPGGAPSYTASVSFTSGQSTTTLATTLLKAETTTITANDGSLTGVASSSLTVNAGAFTKLQLVLPGQTAAPGTSGSGVTGTANGALTGQPFSVTVNSVDGFWNTVTSTDNITLSSTDGAASFSPAASGALVAGSKTFTVTLNTAGSQDLTATDSTDGSKTAATYTLSVSAAQFRSQTSGNWNTAGTWQVSIDGGATWSTPSVTPTSANSTNISILNGHTVTLTAGVTVDDCTIASGGQLTVTNATLTLGGTGVDVFGTLKLADNTGSLISGDTAGTLKFESGGKFTSALHTATAIPTANWDAASTCEILPAAAGGVVPTNLGQAFGHFNWTWTNQTAAVNLAGALTNVLGNLTINSGTNVLRLFNAAGGNISDAVNEEHVGGNFTVAGGIVYTFGTAVNNATNTLFVGGNFTVAAGATLNCPNTGTNSVSIINFNGTGTQTFNNSGTITSTGVNGPGPATQIWVVSSGATLVVNGTTLPLVATVSNPQSRLLVSGTVNLGATGNITGGFTTVNSGGTVLGAGTNAGPVTVSAGGTVQPGTGGTDTSALNFNSSVTLSGNTSLVLNRTNAANASRIIGTTALTAGGMLSVGNVGPDVQGGDVFTLFNRPPSGTFAATSLPSLGTGLNWWTTNNYASLIANQVIAGAATVSRAKGTSLKIHVADLTALASAMPASPADSFTVTGVGSSTNGSTITSDSNYVYLTPANDNGETFTYTVSDARGGSASGTITVNVVAANGQVGGSINTAGGNPNLTFYGIPGRTYTIQVSPDLGAWYDVVTQAADPNGLIQYTDTNPPTPAAYYRLSTDPIGEFWVGGGGGN